METEKPIEQQQKQERSPKIGEAVQFTPKRIPHGAAVRPVRAAIVTALGNRTDREAWRGGNPDESCDGTVVSLVAFNAPDGWEHFDDVPYSPEPAPGCWTWLSDARCVRE